jgi:hypothetical protein
MEGSSYKSLKICGLNININFIVWMRTVVKRLKRLNSEPDLSGPRTSGSLVRCNQHQ